MPRANRPFEDSLRDAIASIRRVASEHRHHCSDYPECETCIVMQVERENAHGALDWILTHVKKPA